MRIWLTCLLRVNDEERQSGRAKNALNHTTYYPTNKSDASMRRQLDEITVADNDAHVANVKLFAEIQYIGELEGGKVLKAHYIMGNGTRQ